MATTKAKAARLTLSKGKAKRNSKAIQALA